jgi:hypothetical protein
MTTRKKMWLKVIALGCFALMSVTIYLSIAEPRARIFYAPVKFGDDHLGIWKEYEEKRAARAPWTQNPETVALRLNGNCAAEAGPPINDCSVPTKFSAYRTGENHLTFVILEDPVVGDDSLAAEEVRLDLTRAADGAWDVEWAGSRWRCNEERSGFGYWSRFQRCS